LIEPAPDTVARRLAAQAEAGARTLRLLAMQVRDCRDAGRADEVTIAAKRARRVAMELARQAFDASQVLGK
jgi:hypothetical protein